MGSTHGRHGGSKDQLEARRRPGPPLSKFVWESFAVAGVLARSPPRSSAPCTTAHRGSCLVVAAFVPPGWLAVEFVRVEAAVLEFLRRMPRLLRFADIRRFIATRSAQISASVATAKEGHGRGLDDYGESIPHELICLGVPLPRHPTDAEALEPSAETARNFVQLMEMCLSHRGDTVYLVHHELRVRVDPDSLDSVSARKHQSFDQRLVLRHVVGGRTDRLRDLIHRD